MKSESILFVDFWIGPKKLAFERLVEHKSQLLETSKCSQLLTTKKNKFKSLTGNERKAGLEKLVF
jgi:hypothetical protein